ncbi:hypothetical protein K466DRAFT_386235 [Polyporus arcularius HHB13444]|uniref:Uncharacterized protein n=1 Tax=Polyporus arcularius HHB13444 TaxID=1314778 RepID=A0A5C3PM84_9APHY|nr:hypothetical protein K466DRAFT_386235 [Polyporus arcularius HHB13444]
MASCFASPIVLSGGTTPCSYCLLHTMGCLPFIDILTACPSCFLQLDFSLIISSFRRISLAQAGLPSVAIQRSCASAQLQSDFLFWTSIMLTVDVQSEQIPGRSTVGQMAKVSLVEHTVRTQLEVAAREQDPDTLMQATGSRRRLLMEPGGTGGGLPPDPNMWCV